jgi:Recombinase/Recombinase zinc beta ribbon domain
MAVSAARGRVNGGPRRYGFEKADGSGTLSPRPAEVAVVESMFEMIRAGKSQMAIARELNEQGHRTSGGHAWSQPKVGQVLRSRIWIGILDNQAGEHRIMEPLIDEELWHAAQRTLSKDGKRNGRHSTRFLLAGGLLRCGGCGSAMAVRSANTPAGMREHYRCMGRRSGAAQCKQPDVPRESIDRGVLEYFAQVALDVEGTVAQIADERDRRLAECDAKLAQARKVQAEAERQVERLDTMMRDEGLTLDEWRRLAAVPQREGEAAALAIEDLTAEREQVEATLDVADAAGEFIERIAELRAAVAGEVTNAESVRATQVALRRVFDGFVLHAADSPAAPRRVDAELGLGVPGYVIEPRVAEDARLGVMPAGTPVLSREPLSLAQGNSRLSRQGRNNRSGSPAGTAGGTPRRSRTCPPPRSRS